VAVSRFDRSWLGIYAVALGFAAAAMTLLRDRPWNMLPVFAVILGSVVVGSTRRSRPWTPWRWMLLPIALFAVGAVVDSIWLYDTGWDDTSYRWLSAAVTGGPLVIGGLALVWKARE